MKWRGKLATWLGTFLACIDTSKGWMECTKQQAQHDDDDDQSGWNECKKTSISYSNQLWPSPIGLVTMWFFLHEANLGISLLKYDEWVCQQDGSLTKTYRAWIKGSLTVFDSFLSFSLSMSSLSTWPSLCSLVERKSVGFTRLVLECQLVDHTLATRLATNLPLDHHSWPQNANRWYRNQRLLWAARIPKKWDVLLFFSALLLRWRTLWPDGCHRWGPITLLTLNCGQLRPRCGHSPAKSAEEAAAPQAVPAVQSCQDWLWQTKWQ